MCLGTSARAQPLPPVAPAAPTMADPAVQAARSQTQRQAAQEGGLATTQLTVNLGGQGQGKRKIGAAA